MRREMTPMFLWTYRQVVWFFVLFLVASYLIVRPNSVLDMWFERACFALAIVGTIAYLTNLYRK